jgi:hypothetical protein
MGNELTQQQENFCQLYVKYGIGAKAYLEAYPKAQKWKRNSLDCEVSKMLNNPKISQRVDALNEKKLSALMNSTKLNQRKLLESALYILEDCQHTPSQYANAINVLKLLYSQQGMMPNASNNTNIQVNIQNNQTVGEVTDYLDL